MIWERDIGRINDLTYDELGPRLRVAAALDPTLRNQLARGQIVPLNSSGTAPLIDLHEVSDACNAAAADADIGCGNFFGGRLRSTRPRVARCAAFRAGTNAQNPAFVANKSHAYD